MLRLVRIIGAEFHQQIPAPLGKEIQVWCSLPLEPVDDTSFKTFQSDRMELQYFWNMMHLAVDLARRPTLRNDVSELRHASSAHGHLRAVVKQNSQLFDVVDRFPSEQRMRSARIISDHPADRAPIMR